MARSATNARLRLSDDVEIAQLLEIRHRPGTRSFSDTSAQSPHKDLCLRLHLVACASLSEAPENFSTSVLAVRLSETSFSALGAKILLIGDLHAINTVYDGAVLSNLL